MDAPLQHSGNPKRADMRRMAAAIACAASLVVILGLCGPTSESVELIVFAAVLEADAVLAAVVFFAVVTGFFAAVVVFFAVAAVLPAAAAVFAVVFFVLAIRVPPVCIWFVWLILSQLAFPFKTCFLLLRTLVFHFFRDYNLINPLLESFSQQKGEKDMDIQKIISDLVAKLTGNKDLIAKFTSDPLKAIKDLLGIDLDASQLDDVVKGVTGQLGDLTGDAAGKAGSILGKIKNMLGK